MFDNLHVLDYILGLINNNLTLIKVILIFIGLYQVYRYLTRNFDFWTKRGIAGPKPVIIFGNAFSQFFTPRPILEKEWLEKFGKIYGAFVGTKPVLVVAEPELIKQILVKDFDIFPNRNLGVSRRHPILSKNLVEAQLEDWRRIKTIVSPVFTSLRMKRMFPLIKKCVTDFKSALEQYEKSGTDVNLLENFGNLTMDVIATCAFATKVNVNKAKDDVFVKNARILAKPSLWRITAIQLMPEFLLKFLNIRSIFVENSNQFFFDLTRLILNERKAKPDENFDDFTQLLMNVEKNNLKDVQDDSENFESHHTISDNKIVMSRRNSLAKFLSEDEILALSWVFFMAGYETTSTTLSFATYELALNQDIQQRLYEEVLTAVDANGDIEYDLLSRLPYLDSVVSETLRLHSPFIRVGRRAASQHELAGIVLDKGMMVEIPVYAIHVNKEFYPEPFKFDPDRFMPENRHKLIQYTYLPFGGGPRNCIGLRFALVEIKLCLTQLIQCYRFKTCPKTDNPVQLRKTLFLNSPKRLIIGIENRNKC